MHVQIGVPSYHGYGCRSLSEIRLFFFSSRRRHTRLQGDWSSDVCSSDLGRRSARAAIDATAPCVPRLTKGIACMIAHRPPSGADLALVDFHAEAWTVWREIGRASCRERV